MQALSTLFLCYAREDRERARDIAEFVQRGVEVRIFLEEGELAPGETLVSKTRDGRMADMVLVLFSRHSLPARWPRSEWEDALVNEPAEEGVRIAFTKCGDCAPPRVLTPVLEGPRQIKRWILGKPAVTVPASADAEALGIALADRAGVDSIEGASVAAEFVESFASDFDASFVLDCAGRSLAALAGDLSAQLGLRLEGDLESNLERLREFCSARRFLIVWTGTDAEEAAPLLFGGRTSTLIVTESRETPLDEIGRIQRSFTAATDWPEICALARQARRLMRDAGRIAECLELMDLWHEAAQACGDRSVLDESAREMVWIFESWGREEEARTLEYQRVAEFGEQMALF